MNDLKDEQGCVFSSRDCRVNPGEGFVPGSVPELHRKARTAPEKKRENHALGVCSGR